MFDAWIQLASSSPQVETSYVTTVDTVYKTEYSTVPSYITKTVEVPATKSGECDIGKLHNLGFLIM